MNYTKVHLEALGYELAPVVVTSSELEDRLAPLYEALHLPSGQLETLTGIAERRWWEPDFPISEGAAAAAQAALARAGLPARSIETLIYAGVCRETFEPATACHVAAHLGVHPAAAVYDVSNACLGVMNGILDVANRIELGQIRAGMIVSAETAREIVDVTIDRMLAERSMESFTKGLATLTGGSGAIAVILTDGSFETSERPRLRASSVRTAPEHHRLCRWGLGQAPTLHQERPLPQDMRTDSVLVMKHGVELAERTFAAFLETSGWGRDDIDRVICHQVGSAHQQTVLRALGISEDKDFSTYPSLGNIGTVSLPITAAIAAERDVLSSGDNVGFLGIGSGLNCMMQAWEW